jgi:hypothetical protein
MQNRTLWVIGQLRQVRGRGLFAKSLQALSERHQQCKIVFKPDPETYISCSNHKK